MKKLLSMVGGLGLIAASFVLALDEHGLHEKMESAGQHMKGVFQAAQQKAMPDVAEHAKGIAEALTGTDEFWAAKNKEDAVKWSKEGVEAANELNKAADGGDEAVVRTAMSKLNAACKSCHSMYRERLPDGHYKIKE